MRCKRSARARQVNQIKANNVQKKKMNRHISNWPLEMFQKNTETFISFIFHFFVCVWAFIFYLFQFTSFSILVAATKNNMTFSFEIENIISWNLWTGTRLLACFFLHILLFLTSTVECWCERRRKNWVAQTPVWRIAFQWIDSNRISI